MISTSTPAGLKPRKFRKVDGRFRVAAPAKDSFFFCFQREDVAGFA